MRENYWTRKGMIVSRRRLLAGGAAAGTGVLGLALAGCGDDNSSNNSKTSAPSASGGSSATAGASPAASATAQPKSGGTLQKTSTTFPTSLDPYATQDSVERGIASDVYSNLWYVKGVPLGPQYPSQDVVADLAKSYEVSSDGLTYTIKLDPKAKWHPPISRQVVGDDIVYAWNRFSGKVQGTPATSVASQLDMVDTVTAPDQGTVVFKLKTPNVLFQWRAADNYTFPIMPPETGTAFDPTKTEVGSGPFMADSFNPPLDIKLKRNPDWHLGPTLPYLDGMHTTIIANPATQLSQFKGENIDSVLIQPKDMKSVKDAIPDVQINAALAPFFSFIAFSGKDPSSPWNKDVRVRYAVSMAIDRNALFQALYSPDTVAAAGLTPPKVLWNGMVPAGLGPSWLDPQGDKMQADLKQYFVHDVDKAKSLLSQAGYPDGFSCDYHYTTQYGAAWTQHAELVQEMVSQIGIKLTTKVDDYNSVYIPHTFTGGDFDGIATIYQGFSNPLDYYIAMYLPDSPRNQSRVNDPTLTTRINNLLTNLDNTSRAQQSLDLQNYLAQKMYYVPTQYNAGPNYTAYQPNIQGFQDYQTARSSNGPNGDAHTWKS